MIHHHSLSTLLIFLLVLIQYIASPEIAISADQEETKPRLIVLADMGNEPDEVQQMHHLLICSNEIDLEGLVAVTGKYLRPEHKVPYRRTLHPELFHQLIDGYAKVVDRLRQHASGWSSPEYLTSIVSTGQAGYGIAATGQGMSSPGSELILAALTNSDPRPLHIVVNAGSNTLAQALRDYRATHSQADIDRLVAKLRVFENGAQDNAGAWICHEFPNVFWIRSNYQTYCYGGPSDKRLGPHTWKPFPYDAEGQDAWANQHVRTNHGELGERFPARKMGSKLHFMEGGGTIPWMGFVAPGLTDPDEPSWGGWSGRFSAEKRTNVWSRHADVKADEQAVVPFALYTEAEDSWTDPDNNQTDRNAYAPVWRWRQAMWNDLQARMDWCVKPFDEANHRPVAVLNGDDSDAILHLSAKPGEILTFDASGSNDADGDPLDFSWWTYPEAGRKPLEGALPIDGQNSKSIQFAIPNDAADKEIHLILETTDQNDIVPLVDYRRVVISVGRQ